MTANEFYILYGHDCKYFRIKTVLNILIFCLCYINTQTKELTFKSSKVYLSRVLFNLCFFEDLDSDSDSDVNNSDLDSDSDTGDS